LLIEKKKKKKPLSFSLEKYSDLHTFRAKYGHYLVSVDSEYTNLDFGIAVFQGDYVDYLYDSCNDDFIMAARLGSDPVHITTALRKIYTVVIFSMNPMSEYFFYLAGGDAGNFPLFILPPSSSFIPLMVDL
jgi:hypothetical protein